MFRDTVRHIGAVNGTGKTHHEHQYAPQENWRGMADEIPEDLMTYSAGTVLQSHLYVKNRIDSS
jgi:hypothetical protein